VTKLPFNTGQNAGLFKDSGMQHHIFSASKKRCSIGGNGSAPDTCDTLGQNAREQEAAKASDHPLSNHEKQPNEFRLLDQRP